MFSLYVIGSTGDIIHLMARTQQLAAFRLTRLLIGVALLGGCQSLSRMSIDSLLDEAPPSIREHHRASKPEIVPQPPPRAESFVLAEDSEIVGRLYKVLASEEDTLIDIARRYGLGYKEIRAANPGVDPWLPRAGTAVLLPTRFVLPDAPREGIVLNLAAMRLFHYPPPAAGEPRLVITHPIAIGREDWPTPQGRTEVVAKVKDPSWNVPASIRAEHAAQGDPLPAVVPPGPDNPLGRYALRLGLPGYLIHGTNKPAGIGMRVTHGCVQLYPEDIESLFPEVAVGTPVRIVDQPVLAGWDRDELYLEAHPALAEDENSSARIKLLDKVLEEALARGRTAYIDRGRAARLLETGLGFPAPIERHHPGLEEVLAAVPVHSASSGGSGLAAADTLAGWYVQAGSFKNPEAAERLSAMLAAFGPPIPARSVASGEYHRVLAGPYRNRSAAEATARRIETKLGAEALVVKGGS